MTVPLIICVATCFAMILCVLFKPQFNVFGKSVSSYWIIVLAGALILIICGFVSIDKIVASFFSDSAINPLKILILFISMALLSIFLDEMGFFRYLAGKTLGLSGSSQIRLFLLLYVVVSVLTVFTSNDIIVLTFTPFICYFAKNAKIQPLPYLINVFVAANTWSMTLIIGNSTNIYLATFNNIDFLSYLKYMILPTVAAEVTAFILLFIIFKKSLSAPINAESECYEIKDKPLLAVGILHLSVCTILLAIGSYIDIEMWWVAFLSAVSLTIFNIVFSIMRKNAERTH